MVKLMRAGTGALAGAAGLALLAAACGSTTTPGKSTTTIPASATQTIQFAESGLGTEGAATQAAINAFEKANPNIKVDIDVLSSDSTTYLQQLDHDFIANSPTPDVFESDVTYPPALAKAGFVMPLNSFNPDLSSFFSNEVAAGQYQGKTYAIPWFINPEGLFYNTSVIKTPPTTPTQLVSEAEAAMKSDKSVKEGLAFEGDKYEGAITAFVTAEGAFGGKLDPSDLDSKGNQEALQFFYDALYSNHIAPTAVTAWQEGQVQQEFTSGHTAFAIDYPFVFSAAVGTPLQGHVGFVPFPAAAGGTPSSALGGEMLAINARSTHAAAAYKLIQYLTSVPAMVTRAESAGDPPAEPAAYTAALYAKDPQFKQIKVLAVDAAARPVTPEYPEISTDLQTMLSQVFSNQLKPDAALSQTAPQVKALYTSSGS